MVACARGRRILDIGCSEGILALLLARAGKQVLGIDVEPAAIAAANDMVNSEPSLVRDRIDLRVADALGVELEKERFDTVILGEVIEHLADPSAILEGAQAFLKPRGRLVLTTPFGYFPHRDHQQEFRTTELVRLLDRCFVVDELTVVDGYFRVIAHARSASLPQERRRRDWRSPDWHQLLVATEEAAIAAQQHLHGQLKHLRSELGRREERITDLDQLLVATEEAAVASQEQLRGKVAELSRRLAVSAEKEQALADKVRRLGRQLEHQKRVIATAQARMQHAQSRLKQQEKGLRQELGRAVEKSLGSPLGVFRLPLRIVKAYRRARRRAEAAQLSSPAPAGPALPAEMAPPRVPRGKSRRACDPAILHHDISSAFPPYTFPDRPPRSDLRVATILDEFSDACFRYEADLIRLTKETWREQIERDRPAFLLVESAWRGNRENWRGLIKNADDTLDNPFDALVSYCRNRGIPTVFWNKEDPPNFEAFIDAAAKFDYVFTTDANCIGRYRERLKHERIAALPFAAQPAIHNPIGKCETDNYEIAFAGTWYEQKHEERGALLPIVLDAATRHKLHIFDRMSGHTRTDFYKFPEKYAPFLREALPYPNVLSAYRSFKLFLNVNSVTDSPTMFARRVFEILASSTAVVSTASAGIEQMLGDVVSLVHDEEEARLELDQLLADPTRRQRKAHLGYRKVMREHTYAARFSMVARAMGFQLDNLQASPKVSVIIPLSHQQWLENALASVRRQRYANLELLWIVKDRAAGALSERVMNACPGGRIIEVGSDASLATMLGCGIEAAQGALITAFDPHDLYGPEFIGDLTLALNYADAEIAGKAAYFAAAASGEKPALHEPDSGYRQVDRVLGTAWLARRAAFERTGIEKMLSVKDGRPMLASGNGSGRIYSADPYNYLRFEAAVVTPAAVAASLNDNDFRAIGRAGIMI